MNGAPARWLFLAVSLLAAGPAAAVFEIRPAQPLSSAHLPPRLPAPFDPLWRREAGRWSLGALHLAPFALPDLSYDAVAAQREERGFAWRAGVGRLSLSGYAEWGIDCAVALCGGWTTAVSLLAVQPGDALSTEAGLRAERTATLSAGWTGSLGGRLRGTLWVRDLALARGARALGLAPAPGVRLQARVADGWEVSLGKVWSGHGSSLRVGLSYSPVSSLRLGHAWTSPDGGREHDLTVRAGPVEGSGWVSQVAPELPLTPGFSVCIHRAGSSPSPPPSDEGDAAAATPLGGPEPARLRPAAPELLEDGLDAPMTLDGELLTPWADSTWSDLDSLGVRWTDADEADSEIPRWPGPRAGTAKTPGLGAEVARSSAIPLRRWTAGDLRRLGIAQGPVADSLAELLRGGHQRRQDCNSDCEGGNNAR